MTLACLLGAEHDMARLWAATWIVRLKGVFHRSIVVVEAVLVLVSENSCGSVCCVQVQWVLRSVNVHARLVVVNYRDQ